MDGGTRSGSGRVASVVAVHLGCWWPASVVFLFFIFLIFWKAVCIVVFFVFYGT